MKIQIIQEYFHKYFTRYFSNLGFDLLDYSRNTKIHKIKGLFSN